MTEEVYKLLETECKLKRAPVPSDATGDEPSTFIFLSEDALANTEKLLVLIHGSGVVRAGQWARRLVHTLRYFSQYLMLGDKKISIDVCRN